eukprot:4920907-Prymnesium_polylepis.1
MQGAQTRKITGSSLRAGVSKSLFEGRGHGTARCGAVRDGTARHGLGSVWCRARAAGVRVFLRRWARPRSSGPST